jgi:hypothetical protein
VFAFPYVLHFFAHEFTRLSGWRETLALVFACPLDWFFFLHYQLVLNNFAAEGCYGCGEIRPRSVHQNAVLTFAQICPVKARMIITKRIKPSPPLGQYPQPELYGQAGSAPINRRTRIINRIVPMASPFGNYFAVWRDFGCGKDLADCQESRTGDANFNRLG